MCLSGQREKTQKRLHDGTLNEERKRIEKMRANFGPIDEALMRLGVLSYGITEDRVWTAEMLDEDDEAGSARRVYV